MICIIALIIFSIMSIFSVRYRALAKEAFDCVFRRMTFRPCTSGLDRRLKTSILGKVSRKHLGMAKFVARHFEAISWFFTILMFVSLFFTAQGIYNYVVYGNCNGEQGGFCVYDALAPQQSSTCTDPSINVNGTAFALPTTDDDPSIGPADAKVTIIEFGCYSCPYTKKAEPIVTEILKKYEGKIKFVYRDFHIPTHPGSEIRAVAANCANDQGKYWEYHDALFKRQEEELTADKLKSIASDLGLSLEFNTCLDSMAYLDETNKDFEDGKLAGVSGTPTFFINGKETIVGVKPLAYFSGIIDRELK
ncbi:MAG: DsbA family protein [Nanoarchaeota archaeon]|nr:DsbA family protein [Nanoarchaeota archaeon]